MLVHADGLCTFPNKMNSNAGTHTPAIPHCRKHGNSGRKCRSPIFFRWSAKKHSAHAGNGNGNASPVNFRKGSPQTKSELSARKLAAGLWQLRFLEVSGDNGAPFPDGSLHFSNSEPELESSPACLKFLKEGVKVTKWDPDLSEASNVLAKIQSRKLLRERKLIGGSVASALLAELLRAQRFINKLKAEHNSYKKKVEIFVKKLEEEKVLWKSRELQKLDDLEDKLARERRSRKRMELLNTKLVHEVAKANLCANKFRTSYEEERKERELLEEVCNELAMQIGEDKAKLEGLQRESMRIREEVEQERMMFQMADLWREESIQMKLVDARLALEDKYNQMIQLIAHLQTFLSSRGDELDNMELRDVHQLIKQAAESLNIQHIAELSYDFSKSDDIFCIYEELRKGMVAESVIESDSPPNLNGPSTIRIISLDDHTSESNT